MNITFEAYKKIIQNMPDDLPEIGGVLGGKGDVINFVELDKGIQEKGQKQCCYAPNVKQLNTYIKNWQEHEIEFYGIFHTHFYGVGSLSQGDKYYMRKIMEAMPVWKRKLYFPIVVLPERKIKGYVCEMRDSKFCILEEDVWVV